MLSLVTAVLFAGYTLVYAAVANGGTLAEHPWEALRRDAYADAGGGNASSSSSVLGKVIGFVRGLLPWPFGNSIPFVPGLP